MNENFYNNLKTDLDNLKSTGTYKYLKYLKSPLVGTSNIENFGETIVMCSNNYAGLSTKKEVVKSGIEALEKYGPGASSVRFICGTFDIHRELEENIAKFLNMESSLTYSSCFSANNAVIPAILKDGDGLISDELNHASIIDGCRLVSKGVKKSVYKHSNMESLEFELKKMTDCKTILIITDGVFSMEGDVAKLKDIVKIAEKYNALVMIDDSHATGAIGKTGRGTMEYHNLNSGVDIISGTLGKALGGAGGGFIAAKKEIIETLIQKSRPMLFSNSLPPVLCAIGNASINYLKENPDIIESLKQKTDYTKRKLIEKGLSPLEGDSPIIPILLYDTAKAIKAADLMMKKGLYAIGFGFPVVKEGEARIRLQISDSLNYEQLDKAIEIIADVCTNITI